MRHVDALEQIRSIIFTGKPLKQGQPILAQEEYVDIFQARSERDPLAEWRGLVEWSTDIWPKLKNEQEAIEHMERLISGEKGADGRVQNVRLSENDALSEEDERDYWLERLYEEIADLETEAEWQAFKARFSVSSSS